jgi:hypothetical protein
MLSTPAARAAVSRTCFSSDEIGLFRMASLGGPVNVVMDNLLPE